MTSPTGQFAPELGHIVGLATRLGMPKSSLKPLRATRRVGIDRVGPQPRDVGHRFAMAHRNGKGAEDSGKPIRPLPAVGLGI
jgi:hypothetical protein